ncbi:hypothetical protein BJ508DRAFT_197603, partial [Ascobolus immersus RN42]
LLLNNPSGLQLFLASVRTVYLRRLPVSYPPEDTWICESKAVCNRWGKWVNDMPLPDERGKVAWTRFYPTMVIDTKKLQLDVGPGENLVLRDEDTKELIGFVYSDLVKNSQILKWMNDTVSAGCDALKSVRKEDPGKFALVGYTAGARSVHCLNWTKSFDTGPTANSYNRNDDGIWDKFNLDISSVFALCWNLIVKAAPEEVVKDYRSAIRKYGVPEMDGQRTVKHFDIPDPISGLAHEFHLAEKAPAGGGLARNYARYIHHEETNLTKFVVSFTTGREGGVKKGGHFYLSDYGVRVQGLANRMVGWQPKELHGTSLADIKDFGKLDSSFNQQGIALTQSNQLPT